ncbi:VWD domain-containing protein, partial [Sanguibacter sp. A247]
MKIAWGALATIAIAASTISIAPGEAAAARSTLSPPEQIMPKAAECAPLDRREFSRSDLCINGRTVRTNGRISRECFNAATLFVVPRGFCSDPEVRQAERIAQARLINHLEGQHGEGSVYWETRLRRIDANLTASSGRADVVTHQFGIADPANAPVDIYEVKLAGNGTTAAAGAQLDSYVRGARETLWSNARRGTATGAYSDEFAVEDYGRCPDGTTVDMRYNVTEAPGQQGLLIVKEEATSCSASGEDENEEPEEVDEFLTELPRVPARTVKVPRGNKTITRVVPKGDTRATRPGARVPIKWGTYEQDAWCLEKFNHLGPRFGSVSVATLACKEAKDVAVLLAEPAVAAVIAGMAANEVDALLEDLGAVEVGDAETVGTSPARVSGDPHLITLDGLNYDLQSVGEFHLLDIAGGAWNLQSRFIPMLRDFSGMGSLAFEIAGSVVELDATGGVWIDGDSSALSEGAGYMFSDSSTLVRHEGVVVADIVTAASATPITVEWSYRAGVGSVGLAIPDVYRGATAGLLGDYDGDFQNDLRLRDGTQLRTSAPAQSIHDYYADSWRIRESESLFTYSEGSSSATHTDLSYPRNITTRGDFSAAERFDARGLCAEYGVPAGPAFDDCELDVLAGGSWAFAATAAEVERDSVKVGDLLADDAGVVLQDFEGEIPNNFDQVRLGAESGLSRFAGPVAGTEELRFYVPALPHHDDVTLSFDVIKFGPWPSSSSFNLYVGGRLYRTVEEEGSSRVGETASGAEFRVATHRVVVDHFSTLLDVVVKPVNVTASKGAALAIDNIGLSLGLVTPHVFHVNFDGAPSIDLSGSTAAPGSGVLESLGAVDRYIIDDVAGGSLYLDTSTYASSLRWTVRQNGETLGSNLFSKGDQVIALGPGVVEVEVAAAGSPSRHEQGYKLGVIQVPEKQSFTLPVTNEPFTLTKDSLGTGSGHIENKASIDEYSL